MQVSSFSPPSAPSTASSRSSAGASSAADGPADAFADLLSQKTASPAATKSAARSVSPAPEKSGRETKPEADTTATEDAVAAALASLLTPSPPPPVAVTVTPTADAAGTDPLAATTAMPAPAAAAGQEISLLPLSGTPAGQSPAQPLAPDSPIPPTAPSSAVTTPSAPPATSATASAAPTAAPAASDPDGVVLRALSVEGTPAQDGVKLTAQVAVLADANASSAEEAAPGATPTVQPGSIPMAPSPAAPIAALQSAEKIAAAVDVSAKEAAAPPGTDQKKSLGIDKEIVGNDGQEVGINAAQGKSAMPALAAPYSSPTSSEHSSLAAVAPTFEGAPKESAPLPAPVAAQVATHAVDTAMAAADRLAAGVQRSVNLQFSVSGVDLGVRVEMRGDAVHTTFHTDSPELRTAIAHEWQAVSVQNESRPQRLADPVFSSGTHSGLGQSGDGSAHQRDSGAREGRAAGSEFTVFRPGARSVATTSVSAAPAASRLAPSLTTRHLHTFA
jgi:hypothetical protein